MAKKPIIVRESTWGASIRLYVGEPEWCKKHFDTKYDFCAGDMKHDQAFFFASEKKPRGFFYVIWLRKWTGKPRCISTLVHEIAHASLAILRHRNMFLGKRTEEAYAYLIDYYTRNFLQKL